MMKMSCISQYRFLNLDVLDETSASLLFMYPKKS
jgi:hypothetical protein